VQIRYVHRPWVWLAVALLIGAVVFGVIRQARASGPSGSLPNLVATAPEEVEFETSDNDGDLSKTPEAARLLLRFNGYLHNDGSGALDMRGSRVAPQVSQAAEEEIEQREKELQEADEGKRPEEPQELSEKTEQELTSPRMDVFQRLYTEERKPPAPPGQTKESIEKHDRENEEYLERKHEEMASNAEMLFVNADGHHHWHLQHVAEYSLWNATRTGKVAPAQKVGFCLEDSEHVQDAEHGVPEVGPEAPVYSDGVAPYRDFCQRYKPYTTHVYEGISPGWRDDYSYQLGFQWVDVSDVLPGEYWLREEVNPERNILEEGKGEKIAYATKPTIVPGFDALSQTVGTIVGRPVTITAASTRWQGEGESLGEPGYTIVSGPRHGTLEPISGTDEAIYTPEVGYSGPDSFTFSASDPSSEFPRNPEVATVAIEVGAAPSVAISGAPAKMYAGSSVQLSAVTDDDSEVTWSASAGSITSGGLYTAPVEPPVGGAVLITARSAKGTEDQIMVIIEPVPAVRDESVAPLPSAPGASSPPTPGVTPPMPPGKSSFHPPILDRSEAMLIGRQLIMTTRVSRAGSVRLSAYVGHRRLGTCAARTAGDRSFTCRLTLGKRLRLDARIAIVASLRIGRRVLRSARPAALVPQMKMSMNMGSPSTKRVMQALGHDASSWRSWWCGPSMGM
jgi:hypothetical protein